MKDLSWRKDIETAGQEISGGTRHLLLFFHDPQDEGSKETVNKVLKEDKVVDHIERECAPLKFDVNENQELCERYNIEWTPTFVIADENGRELERWMGYLPPEDFLPQLHLSKGLAEFHIHRFKAAEREFEEISNDYPSSDLVPEAEYFLGVSRYKESGDTYHLGEVCDRLKEKFPENSWTKRCSVWSGVKSQARRPAVPFDQGGGGGSGAY